MKQSGTTIIFVIICVAVLLAAFGVGICIREIRFSGAKNESKAGNELARDRAQGRPMPGPGSRNRARDSSPEERAGLVEERARMRERFENMSEEERQEYRAQMRERFGSRRRRGGFEELSEEERARLEEERRQMRERWESMSEEERQAYRAQMRERFGGGRRLPGGEEGGRERSGGRRDAEEQENN